MDTPRITIIRSHLMSQCLILHFLLIS